MKKTTWIEKLAQHDKLRSEGNARIYDRVTLLVSVFEDAAFKQAMMKEAKNPLAELNARVSDTCANFTELWQMLKMFPSRAAWEKSSLASMRNIISENLRQVQSARKKEGSEQKLSWKEKYLELENRFKHLQAQYEQLQNNYTSLVAKISGRSKTA